MFFVPISRTIAKERGLKTYFLSKPCKRGEHSIRSTASGKCLCTGCKEVLKIYKNSFNRTEKGKAIKSKIAKKSYEKNKITILERNKKYRNQPEVRARLREQNRLWEKKNREKNPEKANARSLKFSMNNKSKLKEWRKRWNINNRPKKAMYALERRLLTSYAHLQSELTEFVFEQTYELAQQRETLLGIKMHVDHMIPLKAKNTCGLHTWNNFQCLPQKLNNSKRNKLIYTNPHEWLYDIPKFFKVVTQTKQAA